MLIINLFNAGRITATDMYHAIELANQRHGFTKYAVCVIDGSAELVGE